MSCNTRLHGISLEGNSFTEPGLLRLADALRAHPTIGEFSVANQKAPISTAACMALLGAMEQTPTLVHCGLGALRDNAVLRRQQAATMAWHGMAWHGMAWHGMAWHGVAQHSTAQHSTA
jgi:hypothetical protein